MAKEREENFIEILSSGQIFTYEDTYFKGTEKEKTILRKLLPYLSVDGEKYILGYGVDISGLKKANNEILQKNDELNKLSLELDSLVYSLTHDIRSPLHAVLGLIDIVENEEELDDKSTGYISLIKSSIKRVDETINLIFDYSKNTRTGLKIVEIDLVKLVHQSFTHYKKLYKYN